MNLTFMLDTKTISYMAKGQSQAARTALLNLKPDQTACISAITQAEIRYGLARRPQATTLNLLLESMLASLRVLPWGRAEADAYGPLRAKLESKGRTLGSQDMMIAAHALATGSILVTNDQAFYRVEDLLPPINWATDLEPTNTQRSK